MTMYGIGLICVLYGVFIVIGLLISVRDEQEQNVNNKVNENIDNKCFIEKIEKFKI